MTPDLSLVSRSQLLEMFLRSIDPTDAGGQFCGPGSPCRTETFVQLGPEMQQAIGVAQAELVPNILTPS